MRLLHRPLQTLPPAPQTHTSTHPAPAPQPPPLPPPPPQRPPALPWPAGQPAPPPTLPASCSAQPRPVSRTRACAPALRSACVCVCVCCLCVCVCARVCMCVRLSSAVSLRARGRGQGGLAAVVWAAQASRVGWPGPWRRAGAPLGKCNADGLLHRSLHSTHAQTHVCARRGQANSAHGPCSPLDLCCLGSQVRLLALDACLQALDAGSRSRRCIRSPLAGLFGGGLLLLHLLHERLHLRACGREGAAAGWLVG